MKDARTYERKVKKLLRGAKKTGKIPSADTPEEVLLRIIEAVFLADATESEMSKAMAAIQKEFVDYNELRVAPEKDVLECIGKEHPRGREKVTVLHSVLNGLYERANRLSAEYLAEMSKREIRRHLRELSMPPFAEAFAAMTCFGVHAIPVDDTLFEVLQMTQCVHDSSDVNDTQAFLERIVAQNDGYTAHTFFRQYIARHAKALEKKRREDAARRAAEEEAKRKAEEEKARKAAEAAEKKAKAEAEKAARKAEKEAERERKAAERASKKKTAAKKKTAKKPTQKAVRKTAKKTAKKPARKVARKPTKKAAKKTKTVTTKKAKKKK
jgi:flagellar biosynthesis GTPase FlhF